MKRKTNLFYTEGVDSKFLTFSNYTEAMTGNYLSTNIRLFPTMFLCVKLNIQDKEGFIKPNTTYTSVIYNYSSELLQIYVNEVSFNYKSISVEPNRYRVDKFQSKAHTNLKFEPVLVSIQKI